MSTSEDVKRLIREARHSSVTAIHKISTSPRIIRTHTSQLLPLVLQHISEPIPGSQCSQLSATRLILPHYSLVILTEMSDTLAMSRSRPQICRFYQAHWPLICAWVTFFLDKVVVEDTLILNDIISPDYPPDNLDLREVIWTSSIRLLLGVARLPQLETDLMALMASTGQLVCMLIRSWITAADSNHGTLLDTLRFLGVAIPRVVQEDVWETACRSALEQPSSKAASICLRRLTEVISGPDEGVDFILLSGFMGLLNRCLSGAFKFQRSLLENGSVSVITHLMSRTSSLMRSAPLAGMPSVQNFLGHCTAHLFQCFNDSSTWLSVALEGRLVITIFKTLAGIPLSAPTRHLNARDDEASLLETTYATVFNHIRICLVYRSVLREALRSIKTVKGRGLEQFVKGRRKLEASWVDLCQAARLRNDLKSEFDSFGLGACVLRSECLRGNAKSTPTKSCSRCWSVVYCSRDCQAYAWDHGHREECATIVSRRRGGYAEPVSSRDYDFLWPVFHAEYQERSSEIEGIRDSYMEHSRQKGIVPRSPDTIVGLLDFRETPVKVSLDMAEEYKESTPGWSTLFEAAKLGKGKLAAAIFPSGDPAMPESRLTTVLLTLMDPAMDYRQALEQKFLERRVDSDLWGSVR